MISVIEKSYRGQTMVQGVLGGSTQGEVELYQPMVVASRLGAKVGFIGVSRRLQEWSPDTKGLYL